MQWEPSNCMRTDGQTVGETGMTKLIVAFRKFANASKYLRIYWLPEGLQELKGLCSINLSTYLFNWLYSSLKKQLANLYSVKDTQNPASFELSHVTFLFTNFTHSQRPERSKMDAHLPTQVINVLGAESVTLPGLVNPSLIKTLDTKTTWPTEKQTVSFHQLESIEECILHTRLALVSTHYWGQ